MYVAFTTLMQFARLVGKHFEVATLHGSTIQNNMLVLDFSSVVICSSLNIKMAKMNAINVLVLKINA